MRSLLTLVRPRKYERPIAFVVGPLITRWHNVIDLKLISRKINRLLCDETDAILALPKTLLERFALIRRQPIKSK
jgi:hypothetical protein